MNKFDWSDLDARLLQLLVAVVDTGSITAAAQRLGAYFSDRGRLIQADRGRRIGVAVAALGKRAGTGVNVS